MIARCSFGAFLVGFALTASFAEVSVDLTPSAVNTLILGIIVDDEDPIGVAWEPFRAIPAERILNPSGHLRDDGRPDLAYERVTGGGPILDRPVVTWSWNTGVDHDVAIAEWQGAAWTAAEFLTASSTDELDPRLFIESDGTRHVVWWSAGPVEAVWLVSRPAGAPGWSAPLAVATDARRPTVAVLNGTLRVAFERASSILGMAQDVVVSRLAGGAFVEELVASTARTERLDPVLHVNGSRLWLDWKHGSGTFGTAEFSAGAWGALDEPTWTDPTWVGVESVRRVIAGQMTAP